MIRSQECAILNSSDSWFGVFVLKKRKFLAMTFAEVLLTLIIIGVVMTLVIPTMSSHVEKEKTGIALQKAYTVVSNAFDIVVSENMDLDLTKISGDDFFRLYIYPKLNYQKSCSAQGMSSCFDSNAKNVPEKPTQAVILTDGIVIANNGYAVYVDVNGLEGPNVYGADIYDFEITNFSVQPRGNAVIIMADGWKVKSLNK